MAVTKCCENVNLDLSLLLSFPLNGYDFILGTTSGNQFTIPTGKIADSPQKHITEDAMSYLCVINHIKRRHQRTIE